MVTGWQQSRSVRCPRAAAGARMRDEQSSFDCLAETEAGSGSGTEAGAGIAAARPHGRTAAAAPQPVETTSSGSGRLPNSRTRIADPAIVTTIEPSTAVNWPSVSAWAVSPIPAST